MPEKIKVHLQAILNLKRLIQSNENYFISLKDFGASESDINIFKQAIFIQKGNLVLMEMELSNLTKSEENNTNG